MDYGTLINPRERNGEWVDPAVLVKHCECGSPFHAGLDTHTSTESVSFRAKSGRKINRKRRDTGGALVAYCTECESDCGRDSDPFDIRCPRCYDSMLEFGAFDAEHGTMRVSCSSEECLWSGGWVMPEWIMTANMANIIQAREDRRLAKIERARAAAERAEDLMYDGGIQTYEDGSVWAQDSLLPDGETCLVEAVPVVTESPEDALLKMIVESRLDSLHRDALLAIDECKRNGDYAAVQDVGQLLHSLLK